MQVNKKTAICFLMYFIDDRKLDGAGGAGAQPARAGRSIGYVHAVNVHARMHIMHIAIRSINRFDGYVASFRSFVCVRWVVDVRSVLRT